MTMYLERVGWPGDLRALDDVAAEFLADKPLVSMDMTIGKDGPEARIGLFWETVAAHPDDAVLTRLCRRIEGHSWARADRWNGLLTWLEARRKKDGKAARRSLTFKLVVDGAAAPVLKAYVSNFDELGVFPLAHTARAVENAVI
jgi:hypothetical protein